MEDFKITNIPEFKEIVFNKKCNVVKLKSISEQIKQCFEDEQSNFFKLCYYLSELRDLFYSDESYYQGFETDDKRYPFERYVNDFFGLDLRYVEKCIKIFKKFGVKFIPGAGADQFNYTFDLDFIYFSKSKLFELLPVSINQLKSDISNGVLSPDMTKIQIRKYVKNLKGGAKEENKVLEETKSLDEQEESVPDAFDPHKTYKLEYYKQFSKDVLINYLFEFERLVQKLLKKK